MIRSGLNMKIYHYSVLLLLLITFSSCNDNNTDPTNRDKIEISSEPIDIEINVNPDSLRKEQFPVYSVDYLFLKLNGIDLTTVKYLCPASNSNNKVDREFVISDKDSFEVDINNCKNENDWLVDLGSIDFGENQQWINEEVTLVRTEKTLNVDNTINYRFIFQSLSKGKGYICFIEKNQQGEISCNTSHGLLIGYSINPLNKIQLNIDKITWIYNLKEGSFSTVSVLIKGTTNIYRFRGMTYGDGISSAMEIPINNDNSFEVEIPVAFSHVEGIMIKTDSELLLYGTVGLPKIIPLVNPASNE